MSPALIGVIPDNFEVWRKQTMTLNGRVVCTARRTAITIMLVKDEAGWWTVSKLRGGQVLVRKQLKDMPDEIVQMVERARRPLRRRN